MSSGVLCIILLNVSSAYCYYTVPVIQSCNLLVTAKGINKHILLLLLLLLLYRALIFYIRELFKIIFSCGEVKVVNFASKYSFFEFE